MTDIAEGTREILDFWFAEVGPDGWWTKSAETDAAITARFGPLYEEWHGRPTSDFLATPHDALAAIILFDQFPRNMFRHQAKAFATDGLALTLAREAVDREYDAELTPDERSMLYMPFQHSEDLLDQDRSVDLFARLGIENNYDFAAKHRAMVVRFGRFPARNEALGRPSLPEEAEAIEESKAW